MSQFAEAIARTVRTDAEQLADAGRLASRLKHVLASCDSLSFDSSTDALAYASLHLLDRYGRVTQVLEHLMEVGRLPIRRRGPTVLEVGAGPAPAAHATRDFYASVLGWPATRELKVGAMLNFDTLDRGKAWGPFVHHLSEFLMLITGTDGTDGALGSGTTIFEFENFDVRRRHHESVANQAARLVTEFDRADEYISDTEANRMAYSGGVREPSAYDLIFLSNFLTQGNMVERFAHELGRLMSCLTPGGIVIILGATAGRYPALYDCIRKIALSARLRDVSPPQPFVSNSRPEALALVAQHVRENVRWVLSSCTPEIRAKVTEALPEDVVDEKVRFELPKFQALVFVRQGW